MKVSRIFPLFFIIAILLLADCKSPSLVSKILPTLPASYSGNSDSANSAVISWRQYFSDSILVGLIDTALHNNLNVLMALQKIEVARADVKANAGALFPEVSSAGGYSIQKFGVYTMTGAGNISTEITPGQDIPIHLPDYYVGMQSTWEIDIWGKLRNRRKSAAARFLGSIEARKLMVANLVAEVAANYYELVRLDNELAFIKENTRVQQNALDMVKLQKQAGTANDLAVKQFQAQVFNSQSQEIITAQNITIAENRLNFLLGRFPQSISRNDSLFNSPLPVKISIGIPSDLLQNRPDIKAAEYELNATKADVKAAKAEFYPSLNITGTLGFQAFNPSYLFLSPQSVAWSAAGGLVAPLVNRSAIKAQFMAANANQVGAYYSYQQTILNGYVEVYNEFAAINRFAQVSDLKMQEAGVLKEAITTSMDLFKAGKASYLEVLLAQQNGLQSKLDLLDAQQQQLNATVNIYKALGGGWK